MFIILFQVNDFPMNNVDFELWIMRCLPSLRCVNFDEHLYYVVAKNLFI